MTKCLYGAGAIGAISGHFVESLMPHWPLTGVWSKEKLEHSGGPLIGEVVEAWEYCDLDSASQGIHPGKVP